MHHHHHLSHHHRTSAGTALGGSGSVVGIVVMSLTAMLMFGMGAVFFVVAMSVPLLQTGFTIGGAVLVSTGVLMLVIAIVMWRRRANAQRLTAGGLQGQAQIVGVTQTGTFVNDQPVLELQLRVTTATQPPYVVTRREAVPVNMMGRLTSGQPLSVKVDPARPDNLVIVWETAPNQPGGAAPGFGAPLAGFGAPRY